MAAGDKNPVPGGNPTENVATREDPAANRVQEVWETFESFVAMPALKTVGTAGTPVQLTTSSLQCRGVALVGSPANTGLVAVGGDNTVRGTAGTAFRSLVAPIYSEDEKFIQCSNANLLWLDVSVSGEGVVWTPVL